MQNGLWRQLFGSVFGVVIAVQAGLVMTGCGAKDEAISESEAALTKGRTVYGRISYCHDGDTCTVRQSKGGTMTVRLAGIDAPEVSGGEDGDGQPFGKTARNFINDKVRGKEVRIRAIEQDMYGRTIGEIYVNKELVNMAMVEEGMAEMYRWAPNTVDRNAYRSAERQAKYGHKGIWKLQDYESPYEFRKRTK